MNGLEASQIAMRMWACAAVLRVLKRVMPLGRLVRLMHRTPTGSRRSPGFEGRLEAYLATVARFPFRPPSNCLERSLGAYRLLCAANVAPELVIGVRHSAERGVEGHVWVTVGGRPLAERSETLAAYTAIVTFDAEARQRMSATSERTVAGLRPR